MSAIFGLVDYGRPAHMLPRKAASLMARVQGEELAHEMKVFADGWLAMAHLPSRYLKQKHGENIFLNDDHVIVAEGEIFHSRAHQLAQGETENDIPFAAFVARGIRRLGYDFLGQLDGSFRIFVWDKNAKELVIATDRHGLRPLYYGKEKDRVVFGSEVKFLLEVLAGKPEIDKMAIHDFINFGQLVDDRTYFKNIKRLPHGHWLRISEHDFSLHRYDTDDVSTDLSNSIKGAEDGQKYLHYAAMHGVKEMSQGTTGIVEDGGIDSRMISAAQRRLGISPSIFSSGSDEVLQNAAHISEKTGGVHYHEHLTPQAFLENFSKAVWFSDGQVNGNENSMLNIVPLLRENPMKMMVATQPIGGNYNQEFLSSLKLKEWDEKSRVTLVQKLFNLVHEPDNPLLPEGNLFTKAHAPYELHERLGHLTEGWETGTDDPVMALLNFDERLRIRFSESHMLQMLRHFVPVSTPFYTFAYREALDALSVEWRGGEKLLIKQTVDGLNPELAQIPLLSGYNSEDESEYTIIGFLALNNMWKARQGEMVQSRTSSAKSAFSFSALLYDRDMYEKVKHLLLGTLAEDIFNRRTVTRLFTQATRESADVDYLLGRIITINLWHRYFVKGEGPVQDLYQPQSMKFAV